MIQANTNWEDRKTVKKGNIGEEITRQYLESKGYIIYKPLTEGAHSFDNLAIKGKTNIFIVEVKTKPRRKYYNDTGIDIRHYKTYREVSKKHNLKVFIFFIDEIQGLVYGNDLNNLIKPVDDKKKYPLVDKGIVYFHLSNMIEIAKLTQEQVEDIKAYSTSNYTYS